MFVTKKRIMRKLQRIEGGLQEVLARLEHLMSEKSEVQAEGNASRDHEPDKLLQEGINNILAYQAGKKRSDGE